MTDAATETSPHRTGASTNGERMFSGERFIASVERSLVRAAKQAHLLAYQGGAGVVYTRNGISGVYKPDPAMYEDLIPPPFEDEQVLCEEEQSLRVDENGDLVTFTVQR